MLLLDDGDAVGLCCCHYILASNLIYKPIRMGTKNSITFVSAHYFISTHVEHGDLLILISKTGSQNKGVSSLINGSGSGSRHTTIYDQVRHIS